MDGEGFEPSKASPADLQSAPFGHSGIHPYKSRQSESNQQPIDYKSIALPLSHVGKTMGPIGLEPMTLCL